jgi:hypothetical protein
LPLCGLYCGLSIAEHLILESSNKKISQGWNIRELTEMNFFEQQPELTIRDEEANVPDVVKQNRYVNFDFTKHKTKLIYAGVKFIIALMLGIHYILYFRMIAYKYTKNGLLLGLFPFGKKKSKSMLMLLVLIVLTIYRDKFEKKISSSYEPSKLHFGRAILTPLVYVSFTVMMILE